MKNRHSLFVGCKYTFFLQYSTFFILFNVETILRNNSAIIYFNTRSTLSLRLSKNFHALDFVASLVEELTINYVLEWT